MPKPFVQFGDRSRTSFYWAFPYNESEGPSLDPSPGGSPLHGYDTIPESAMQRPQITFPAVEVTPSTPASTATATAASPPKVVVPSLALGTLAKPAPPKCRPLPQDVQVRDVRGISEGQGVFSASTAGR